MTFNVTGNANAALLQHRAGDFVGGLSVAHGGAERERDRHDPRWAAGQRRHDRGGGDDTSAPKSFTITITPVNDAPSFKGANPIAVPVRRGQWAHDLIWMGHRDPGAGPTDETGQALTFDLTRNMTPPFRRPAGHRTRHGHADVHA